ncbi:MAG: adenylate/guanylate cyclase domain-containing protein [Candidatus Pacearchaeota archaeon]|jgi:class 3 adenylate cyclase
MNKQRNYLNEGAEEFIDSLKPGTTPRFEDEEEFFDILKKDSADYLDGKINRLEDPEYKEKDPSEEFLYNYYKTTKKKVIEVAILSIDVVDSTKLSHVLTQENYAKVISVILREISHIIYNYNGYALKYVGDEIMAYFPGPDINGMHDNALFCAYGIKKYILKILNPLLNERSFPEIKFRISLNSGKAILTVVGHPNSMQHFDLIGEPINTTKKIQLKSEINAILLGESTKSFTHQFWNSKIDPILVENENNIKVYRLNILV